MRTAINVSSDNLIRSNNVVENAQNGIILIGHHVLYHVGVVSEQEHSTVVPRLALFLVLGVLVRYWNIPAKSVTRTNARFGRLVHGRTVQSRVRLGYDHEWFRVFIILEKWKENSAKNHRDQFYPNDVILIFLARNGLILIGPTVP